MGRRITQNKEISAIKVFTHNDTIPMVEVYSPQAEGEESLSYVLDEHDNLYIRNNGYTLAFYRKDVWLKVSIEY